MPSRPLPPPPSPSPLPLRLHHRLLRLLPAAAAAAALLLTLIIVVCLYFSFLRRRRRSPTLPSEYPAAALRRRFSYGGLRSATANFDASRLLGRGASASVYRGVLPSGKSVAVKLITSRSPSPTSDLEFKNELHVLSSLRLSPFVVSLLGYCDRRRRRLLVYEYLSNGSLQEALFGSPSSPSSLGWDRRFQIILDVASGLRFLHLECDPPVVHGDVKPSNVLLGSGFRAKIADFGLARLKINELEIPTPPQPPPPPPLGADDEFSQDLGFFPSQELCSLSPQTDFEFEFLKAGRSNFEGGRVRCNPIAGLEDEEKVKGKEAAVTPFDDELENRKELNDGGWWWKQEGSGELSSRDYVREWIGSQICPSTDLNWDNEEKKSDLDEARVAKSNFVGGSKRKKQESCADSCGRKSGSAREWWKEEYFAEMSKKQKCSKGISWFRKASNSSDNNVHSHKFDRELSWRRRKKKSKSTGSEMFSGDLFSRDLSSTATSMRGTICYVAPEHGGCGQLMEKTDIYSFGVLVLVIVSGRRPLHVLSSPMKLERANLVSWCRQLASTGNVLDLVDERLRDCFDKEQASLCVNLALLCLHKMPELRPDSGEVVKILKGEMDLPVVPLDFSPSPNSKVSSKRRKAVHDPE